MIDVNAEIQSIKRENFSYYWNLTCCNDSSNERALFLFLDDGEVGICVGSMLTDDADV